MRTVGDPEADSLLDTFVKQNGQASARHLFALLTDKLDITYTRFLPLIKNFFIKSANQHHREQVETLLKKWDLIEKEG